MRTTSFHVEHATKEQLQNEYKRIKNKTSTLSRKFRDLIVAKVEVNNWQS